LAGPVYYNNIDIIELLLAKRADINSCKEKTNRSILSIASLRGYKYFVKFLLGCRATTDPKGCKLLDCIYIGRHKDFVELLLYTGTRLNFLNKYNLPIFQAVSKKNKDIVYILINKGTEVNIKGFYSKLGKEISVL
jgi:ankyrin repeat protein